MDKRHLMDKVLVFSPKKSTRLMYVLEYFSSVLELHFCHTDNFEVFRNATDIRVNYSAISFENVLQILPVELLFENDIHSQKIACSEWHNLPCFFVTNKKNNDIPFDVFAATFYLITRYEEYLTIDFDEHGRFSHKRSLAFQNGFLQRPIADLWAFELLKLLNPDHKIERKFEFLPTIDVDNFYKYRRKGLFGSMFLFAKALLKVDFADAKTRLKVLLRKQEDPFFNFDDILDLHCDFDLVPRFFFHVGGCGRFDKKVLFPMHSKRYNNAIRQIAQVAHVGIHPSYNAAFSEGNFWNEKKRLEKIVGRNVCRNRFHFLRFQLPESYRMLVKYGIKSDYSMLYANELGFRAGTSLPFMFFDLKENKKSSLKIYPTAIMDTTLLKKMHLGIDNLSNLANEMMSDVIKTKGVFVTLFHNEHLANNFILDFYKKMLKTHVDKNV